MAEYPEHNKLQSIAHFSQKIGEFVEWLGEMGIELVRAHKHTDGCKNEEGRITCCLHGGELFPIYDSKEKLLAEFFGIDLKKLEEEKRQILDEMRRPGQDK